MVRRLVVVASLLAAPLALAPAASACVGWDPVGAVPAAVERLAAADPEGAARAMEAPDCQGS